MINRQPQGPTVVIERQRKGQTDNKENRNYRLLAEISQ